MGEIAVITASVDVPVTADIEAGYPVLVAVGIRVNLAEKAAERGPKKGSSEAPWFVAKGEKRIQNGGSSVSLVRSLRAGRYCSRYSSSRRIP
jgi:hypothetical protein